MKLVLHRVEHYIQVLSMGVYRYAVQNPYKTLAGIIFVTLFQVSTGLNLLKWDNLSLGFAYSNYLSQCVHNGFFPYWNPYTHLGIPIYGDLVSRFHYPLPWVFFYTTGYSIWCVHLELVTTYLFTAWGAYSLFYSYVDNKWLSILFGCSIAFCGAMVGHAQHLTIILGYCFFVWGVYFIICLFRDKSPLFYAIALGILLSMDLCGGYIGITIISFYIYLVLAIYLMVRHHKFHYLPYLVLSVFIFLFLSLGFFYSLYIVYDDFARKDGLSAAGCSSDPFGWMSFFSMLNPGIILSHSPSFQNDLSMRNGYLGLFALPLLYYYIRSRKAIGHSYFLVFGIIFLCIAMGDIFPFRRWLYYTVPLMNLFRFSALFRFWAEGCFLWVSLLALHHIYRSHQYEAFRKILKYYFFFYVIATLVFFSILHSEDNLIQTIELYTAIGSVQLTLLGFAIYYLSKAQSPTSKIVVISLVFLLDGIITTHFLEPILVFDYKSTVYSFHSKYKKHLREFDYIPRKTLAEYSNVHYDVLGNWMLNDNLILKEPSLTGYYPFKLKSFYTIEKIKNVAQHPIVYSPTAHSTIMLVHVHPTSIKSTVVANQTDTIVLLQNNFKGWKAKLDGKSIALLLNSLFPKTIVPEGNHTLEYYYEMPMVKTLLYFQHIALAILLVGLIYLKWKEEPRIS